tara:strand:+ start:830 stop:1228 length:399 start_codon:yes stop_codon:yes gene_type:complete
MDMNVLELKRKLSLRKRKYETGLHKLIELFNIKDKEYMKDFDYLSEKMIELGIKYNSIQKEMNEVDIEFGRLKQSILLKENINLMDELDKYSYDMKTRVIDELFNEEFIGNDEWEILKGYVWENRYKKVYSD